MNRLCALQYQDGIEESLVPMTAREKIEKNDMYARYLSRKRQAGLVARIDSLVTPRDEPGASTARASEPSSSSTPRMSPRSLGQVTMKVFSRHQGVVEKTLPWAGNDPLGANPCK